MAKVVLTLVLLFGTVFGCWAQMENFVRPVEMGEYSSVVFVSTPRDQQCIGIVINANHVLTSGTCVMTNQAASIYPPRLVQVIGGNLLPYNPGPTRQIRTAQHIFVHENFRVRPNDNNIAIIRLAAPFHLPSNAIEEAHIRMRIVPEGYQCDVVRVAETGTRLLLAYNVFIRNRNLCDSCCFQLIRNEENLCVETITDDNIGLVQGDAMFCDGELTAIAATSVSQGQTRRFHFSQIRFYTHWIQQQLTRTHPMPVGWNPNEF
ncbi:uncharacterized protein LOC125771711 [Anopheles funestus]|uniref:uncharacterized protein LOC125771711 n=1 Tax=Anopheles funestus TaxID=62324 RepID=UPI0020C72AD9|nr:uncharacterized protein LOC125771711 [Anopheles funestus]